MSAICAKFSLDATISKTEILQSLERMPSRGGASQQIYLLNNFGIGCACRSSSSEDGLFHSDDKKIRVAVDGNIFNIEQMAKEHGLKAKLGHNILPWLYQLYGENFITRLEGSFSIIVWDEIKKVVVLAKDHIGSKPLFYSCQRGSFAFSSEIDGLLGFDNIETSLNFASMDSYLTHLYVPAPDTLLSGISQIKPAHIYIFSNDRLIAENSYLKAMPSRFSEDDLPSWSIQFQELLKQSIKLRIDGKSKLGFLLSGGSDTAALVGCASSISNTPLKTFTLGFPGCPEVDERKDAEKTARHFQTDHTVFEVDHTCIDMLPEITRQMGAPVGNPASLIAFSLFKQFRGSIDTVVCGDGGNEMLGGVYIYNQVAANLVTKSFFLQKAAQKLRAHMRETIFEPLFQRSAKLYFERIGKNYTLNNNSLDGIQFQKTVDFYALLESRWTNSNKMSLYAIDIRKELVNYNSLEFLTNFFIHDKTLPALQQLIFARTNSFLPYNAIPYIEFNATSNNVFSLFPFMDKELMNFMYKIPFEYIYAKSPRYFMKQALADNVVPAEIFRRPLKGFSTPIDIWLKTPKWKEIVYDHLSAETVKKRGLFSPAYVNKLVHRYYSGEKYISTEHPGKVQNLGLSIWSLVAFESWCQIFI